MMSKQYISTTDIEALAAQQESNDNEIKKYISLES